MSNLNNFNQKNLSSRAADSLPSRNTLKSRVIKYTDNVMKKVISNLQDVKNFFFFMDIWSQPGLDKFYLGIVAIYYNPKTEKQEVAALACRDFPHPHTGVRIRELFESIFKEHGLDPRKVIRFTTDKGSNIVNGLQPYTVVQQMPTAPSVDVDLLEEEALNENATETDSFVEIELDIKLEDGGDESDQSEEEFDLESEEDLEGMDANAVETEYNEFLAQEEFYRQAFGKRMSMTCFAHALNLVFHKVLDDKKSNLGRLRKELLKKINSSGVANQQLKLLTGKKLLKAAKPRWNSFYYVLKRILLLKTANIDVCRDRLCGIEFQWSDVEKYVSFLKPLAVATTYLEGDYPTAASIIP